ncbi:pregnancy-specific glycoprotein 22-like [Microtus pennsylvanicus]|uniref:pregnancy-specific glycoprotein 22-like n=1 Tax=Microtus pennsylvanicus TaxID=10058 RepID=UPI003F6D782C
MGVSLVILCQEGTLWQGLLLTASLLGCCLSTTDYITIKSVQPHVASGEDVLLHVHNLPEDILAFAWFKGATSMKHGIAVYALNKNLSATGPAHSGRETVYRNGSLLLQSVTEKDTGFYTLRTLDRHGEIVSTTTMRLYVYPFLWTCGRLDTSAQPTVESVPPRVAEGGSVLLLVHNPPENIVAFIWFKELSVFKKLEIAQYIIDSKSTVFGPAYSGRETLYSDGSLLLYGVTQKDSGLYTLRILRTDMRSEEAQVQLQVHTSLSPCCNPLASSRFTIQAVPQYANEGEGVVLQVHNLPQDLLAFTWYKSNNSIQLLKIVEYNRATNYISWGPERRRRGMVLSDGSLMFQVTEKDAGMYTLEVLNKDFKTERAYVEFYVKKSVTQPFVRISDTTVAGRRSVIFSCISPDTDVSIRWIFNNKSMPHLKRMTLSPTKCGLRIDPVRREDAGEYKCEVSNRVSSKTSLPVTLDVMND